MIRYVAFMIILVSLFGCGSSDSIFEFSPNQSMLLTGKGPGQDGAINPYSDRITVASIENLGKSAFSARVQKQGMVKSTTNIEPDKNVTITLDVGDELYVDTEFKAKARITFAPKE